MRILRHYSNSERECISNERYEVHRFYKFLPLVLQDMMLLIIII